MADCNYSDIDNFTSSGLCKPGIDLDDLADLNASINETQNELDVLCQHRINAVCPFEIGKYYEWTVGDKRPRRRYCRIEHIEPHKKQPYYVVIIKLITPKGQGGIHRMCQPERLQPYSGGIYFVDADKIEKGQK